MLDHIYVKGARANNLKNIDYLEEIENLCDRVAILSNGKLLKTGTIEEIKQITNTQNFEDAFIKLVEAKNE